jgi:malate dehydrogenase (oxaloacetate-decarboxylating)
MENKKLDIFNESLEFHRKHHGKIAIKNKTRIKDMHDMSLAYTPGVASSCLAIKDNPSMAYELTSKRNTIAVISDGSAVLGLGDIGPLAGLPVMEGKCALFKRFAGVDAIPIVLNTKDVDELVRTIYLLSVSFGGINLEDISAPRCFEVERRLKEICDIPVFHDDQHGTAIVCAAALLNALKVVDKKLDSVKIVVNGAGSAGIAISKFLLNLGAKNLILCDRFGTIYEGSPDILNNPFWVEISKVTNKEKMKTNLAGALKGADVFIGVSVGNIVSKEMVGSMAPKSIVFPLANPISEISREDALAAGAAVVGTGVSDKPNQINNSLIFPGLFKGALKGRAVQITNQMEINACYALASIVKPSELNPNYIIPNIFHKDVSKKVALAVIKGINH